MRLIKLIRKWWTGHENGCFFCRWDDPRAATRYCVKCDRIEVMSHL